MATIANCNRSYLIKCMPSLTGTSRIAEAPWSHRLQSDVVRLLPATRPGTYLFLMAHDGHHPGQESNNSNNLLNDRYFRLSIDRSNVGSVSVCLSGSCIHVEIRATVSRIVTGTHSSVHWVHYALISLLIFLHIQFSCSQFCNVCLTEATVRRSVPRWPLTKCN